MLEERAPNLLKNYFDARFSKHQRYDYAEINYETVSYVPIRKN